MLEWTYFLIGLLAGSLLTLVWCRPAIGWAFLRILSVVILGIGVGLITWGSLCLAWGETPRPMLGNLITQVSEAFAWGAGFFVGGMIGSIYSFRSGPGKTKGGDFGQAQ